MYWGVFGDHCRAVQDKGGHRRHRPPTPAVIKRGIYHVSKAPEREEAEKKRKEAEAALIALMDSDSDLADSSASEGGGGEGEGEVEAGVEEKGEVEDGGDANGDSEAPAAEEEGEVEEPVKVKQPLEPPVDDEMEKKGEGEEGEGEGKKKKKRKEGSGDDEHTAISDSDSVASVPSVASTATSSASSVRVRPVPPREPVDPPVPREDLPKLTLLPAVPDKSKVPKPTQEMSVPVKYNDFHRKNRGYNYPRAKIAKLCKDHYVLRTTASYSVPVKDSDVLVVPADETKVKIVYRSYRRSMKKDKKKKEEEVRKEDEDEDDAAMTITVKLYCCGLRQRLPEKDKKKKEEEEVPGEDDVTEAEWKALRNRRTLRQKCRSRDPALLAWRRIEEESDVNDAGQPITVQKNLLCLLTMPAARGEDDSWGRIGTFEHDQFVLEVTVPSPPIMEIRRTVRSKFPRGGSVMLYEDLSEMLRLFGDFEEKNGLRLAAVNPDGGEIITEEHPLTATRDKLLPPCYPLLFRSWERHFKRTRDEDGRWNPSAEEWEWGNLDEDQAASPGEEVEEYTPSPWRMDRKLSFLDIFPETENSPTGDGTLSYIFTFCSIEDLLGSFMLVCRAFAKAAQHCVLHRHMIESDDLLLYAVAHRTEKRTILAEKDPPEEYVGRLGQRLFRKFVIENVEGFDFAARSVINCHMDLTEWLWEEKTLGIDDYVGDTLLTRKRTSPAALYLPQYFVLVGFDDRETLLRLIEKCPDPVIWADSVAFRCAGDVDVIRMLMWRLETDVGGITNNFLKALIPNASAETFELLFVFLSGDGSAPLFPADRYQEWLSAIVESGNMDVPTLKYFWQFRPQLRSVDASMPMPPRLRKKPLDFIKFVVDELKVPVIGDDLMELLKAISKEAEQKKRMKVEMELGEADRKYLEYLLSSKTFKLNESLKDLQSIFAIGYDSLWPPLAAILAAQEKIDEMSLLSLALASTKPDPEAVAKALAGITDEKAFAETETRVFLFRRAIESENAPEILKVFFDDPRFILDPKDPKSIEQCLQTVVSMCSDSHRNISSTYRENARPALELFVSRLPEDMMFHRLIFRDVKYCPAPKSFEKLLERSVTTLQDKLDWDKKKEDPLSWMGEEEGEIAKYARDASELSFLVSDLASSGYPELAHKTYVRFRHLIERESKRYDGGQSLRNNTFRAIGSRLARPGMDPLALEIIKDLPHPLLLDDLGEDYALSEFVSLFIQFASGEVFEAFIQNLEKPEAILELTGALQYFFSGKMRHPETLKRILDLGADPEVDEWNAIRQVMCLMDQCDRAPDCVKILLEHEKVKRCLPSAVICQSLASMMSACDQDMNRTEVRRSKRANRSICKVLKMLLENPDFDPTASNNTMIRRCSTPEIFKVLMSDSRIKEKVDGEDVNALLLYQAHSIRFSRLFVPLVERISKGSLECDLDTKEFFKTVAAKTLKNLAACLGNFGFLKKTGGASEALIGRLRPQRYQGDAEFWMHSIMAGDLLSGANERLKSGPPPGSAVEGEDVAQDEYQAKKKYYEKMWQAKLTPLHDRLATLEGKMDMILAFLKGEEES